MRVRGCIHYLKSSLANLRPFSLRKHILLNNRVFLPFHQMQIALRNKRVCHCGMTDRHAFCHCGRPRFDPGFRLNLARASFRCDRIHGTGQWLWNRSHFVRPAANFDPILIADPSRQAEGPSVRLAEVASRRAQLRSSLNAALSVTVVSSSETSRHPTKAAPGSPQSPALPQPSGRAGTACPYRPRCY